LGPVRHCTESYTNLLFRSKVEGLRSSRPQGRKSSTMRMTFESLLGGKRIWKVLPSPNSPKRRSCIDTGMYPCILVRKVPRQEARRVLLTPAPRQQNTCWSSTCDVLTTHRRGDAHSQQGTPAQSLVSSMPTPGSLTLSSRDRRCRCWCLHR
jgi:hypothetical protein